MTTVPIPSRIGIQTACASGNASPVVISHNEGDARVGSDPRLLHAANGSDEIPAVRLTRPAPPPPVSRAEARAAMSSLWNVYVQCRKTLGLDDSGRKHDDLKSRVEAFMKASERAEMDAKELRRACDLFGTMQRALTRHADAAPRFPRVYESAMYVSRGLKWQFRASAHESIKRKLDQALHDRLASMKPGSSESMSASLASGVNVIPGVGVKAGYGYDTGLSFTPTEWLVDTSGHRISLAGDTQLLGFMKAELKLSGTASRSETYASLSDYVASASHKTKTWLRQGPLTLIAKIRDLFSLSSTYERDVERADISRHFLDKHMRNLCGKSFDIVGRDVQRGPIERHDTLIGEVSGGASAEIGVSANVKVAARKYITLKHAEMDILSLAESKPDDARRLLSNTRLVHDAASLIQAAHAHIETSSERFTLGAMAGIDGGGRKAMEAGAQHLLEQFALLKLDGDLPPDTESLLMDVFTENQRILRPKALAVHQLSCRQNKWQAELDAGVRMGVGLPVGANATVTFEKVTEDEDANYCGNFLNVTISGAVNALGSVMESLNAAGVRAGGTWGLADIENALRAGDVSYEAGVVSTLRFKLKESGIALMYSTRGVQTTLGGQLSVPSTPISGTVGMTQVTHSADMLTIGSGCLDLLAPLARMRLAKPDFGGPEWWSGFAENHRKEFDDTFANIAERRPGTPLEDDLQRIVREVPATRALLDTLTEAARRHAETPTPSHRAEANRALADFMLAYVKGGYAEKTSSHWSLSTDRKRLPQRESSPPPVRPQRAPFSQQRAGGMA
ncbi:hypothetical protein [Pandoraea pnomenusa]|uniref:hypothetical protein n=1 Tax=Pandoraea pnomenusa TaxID=93220 RepID=UPI000A5406FB|nr:hypothetical protein [Pandoraea pnomenusa]